MKRILFGCALALVSPVFAQEKALTIEDAVLKQRDTLAPQRLEQLNWIPGTEQYYYIKSDSTETWLWSGTPGRGMVKQLLSLSELNKALQAEKPLKKFPALTWKTPTLLAFAKGEKKYTFDLSAKALDEQNTRGGAMDHADAAPATGYIAYTRDNNLLIRKGNQDVVVTQEENPGVVCGQSVHRDEFGISKGTFWSPSGKQLAFYRMDQTMVTDYPVMDLNAQPAGVNMIKYPMAGGKSHEVTIGIFNTETGKTVYLETGEPREQYLTNIAWSPDEQNIYVAVLNRDQNHLWMNRYSAVTGAFDKTLFEETSPVYVHPMHPLKFVPGNPKQFVWMSERDGLDALYLYDINGKLIRRLTESDPTSGKAILVYNALAFSEKGNMLYFTATPMGNITKQLFAVTLPAGKVTQLTTGEGTHEITFNSKATFYIDNFSAVDVPRKQSISSAAGKVLNVLLEAQNPLKDYKQCKIKLHTIKAADGATDLWCRTIYPANFNEDEKYPALVYVYNGPNVQLIRNSWLGGADLFLYYMAQQGYIVFTVDGRGSDNRGLGFEQATFRKLGTVEMDDQEKGVQYLRSIPNVDSKRIAVYGWSYGGFMTTSLLSRKPGLFSCGVAGGPVIDWSYYEVMYTERYMDTPQTNKEGYEKSSLLNYVDKLQGKLLLIHGTADDVVVWQHSLLYLKKAVETGKQVDYFVYPGHLHNVLGKDRVHLLKKVAEYIITNNK